MNWYRCLITLLYNVLSAFIYDQGHWYKDPFAVKYCTAVLSTNILPHSVFYKFTCVALLIRQLFFITLFILILCVLIKDFKGSAHYHCNMQIRCMNVAIVYIPEGFYIFIYFLTSVLLKKVYCTVYIDFYVAYDFWSC